MSTSAEVTTPSRTVPVYLTPVMAAERLNISRASLDKLIRRGAIPARRLGRKVVITEAELDAAVRALPSY